MSIRVGVVMDPIDSIVVKKDTTLAMMLAAQRRGWELRYMELGDLFVHDGAAHARMHPIAVRDDPADWYTLGEPDTGPLASLDVILMRKDPPFDMEFVYATYILERAEAAGVLVVNKPQSLRDANEKMFTAWFPQCCPPTLVTREHARMGAFLEEHGDIIVKPLDGMGGASIFRVRGDDPNVNVVFETLTRQQTRYAMCQRYIPEIRDGDKRVLLIEGEPVEHVLARVPGRRRRARQPRGRGPGRRDGNYGADARHRARGGPGAAREGPPLRRTRRHRRLPHRDQRHQSDVRSRARRRVRGRHRRKAHERHRGAARRPLRRQGESPPFRSAATRPRRRGSKRRRA